MNGPGKGKGKRHATNPSWMRARRNGEAVVTRAAKQAHRRAREHHTPRAAVVCEPVMVLDELHVWGPGWEAKLAAVLALAVRGT